MGTDQAYHRVGVDFRWPAPPINGDREGPFGSKANRIAIGSAF